MSHPIPIAPSYAHRNATIALDQIRQECGLPPQASPADIVRKVRDDLRERRARAAANDLRDELRGDFH